MTVMNLIINLTPHVVRVLDEAGNFVRELPPAGMVARVSTQSARVEDVDGLPVYVTTFGALVGLPAHAEGVTLLVSLVVRTAAEAAGRRDVVSPGELVRGPDGQPVGCRGLTRGTR